VGLVDLQELSELPANTLSDPPFLLVHLELLEDANQSLSLLFTHDFHDVRNMLNHSQLYLVTFIFEKDVDHFK
jgi:hypothetical protein